MGSDPFLIAVGIIGSRELTDELLGEVMGMLPKITPSLTAGEVDQIRKQLEATIGISMVTGQGLHGEDQEPWLEEVKANVKWNYWDAYTKELQSSGFGRDVLRVLDEDTDNILNECGDPAASHGWSIKGLVMGDVQSGKTASYCGLINKAADTGYKFVVLLTGMIEELRAQSQERLDQGFVGRDSRMVFEGQRGNNPIGSGRFRAAVPNVLTSIDFDFLTANKKVLGGIPLENIKEPVLLVMKKNSAPLKNLIAFLDSQLPKGSAQLSLPFLLLDDEADNASVNAKKDEDPATINRLIREVLKRFSKSSYVAYTATPFANVFITPDSDDLFPKNFIYSLNTPSNYIGASRIFSESGSHGHQLVDITDADEYLPYKHDKNLPIQELPISLREAVGVFLISCAIRDLRKEPLKHRSMLVNVTRFTDVQNKIALILKDYLYSVTEDIKQYLADDDIWHKHASLKALCSLWQEHYADCGVTWDEVRSSLYEAIASVKVVTINQKSDATDRLNYGAYKKSEKGRRVIAVGGLTLSRGLTLEGLCVSYFYRNSKAYDTLLQMGRWFGYRPGYDDLCKIWMDPEVQDWFSHIADVVGELRYDIRRMHANKQPPSRFGMRVRSHPNALIVTALNKMRNSQEVEVKVSYSGCGAETPFVPVSPQKNAENLRSIRAFIEKLGPAKLIKKRPCWHNVSAAEIAALLGKLEISNMNMEFIPDLTGRERPIISFIGNSPLEELKYWDVCFPQGQGEEITDWIVCGDDGSSFAVKPRFRQFEKTPQGADYLKMNRQRVGEIGDEMFDLDKDDLDHANRVWEDMRDQDPKLGKTIPAYIYRQYRKRPLLTIHVIAPKEPDPDADPKRKERMMKVDDIQSKALVAIGVSFPKFEKDTAVQVSYQLNKVALRSMGLIAEQEADDDED